MLSYASLVVAASMVVGQAAAGQTPIDQFGDAFAGRWVGEVKLVADWPGLGSKGEKIVGFIRATRVAGKSAVKFDWVIGDSVEHCLHVWDAANEKIRFLSSSSKGTIYHGEMSKSGDSWPWQLEGSFKDGTSWSGRGTWTVSNDGNTATLEGDFIVGGEKTPHVKDVYRRITR